MPAESPSERRVVAVSAAEPPAEPRVATALRVLMVEDQPDDAELEQRALRRADLDCTALVVDTEAAFREALQTFSPQVILCDYSLPSFSGEAALDIATAVVPEVPFIFVSGVLGEERAVELLKRGAADYILKDRLIRLGPAVRSELAAAAVAEQKRCAERELVLANRNLRTLSSGNQTLVKAKDEPTLLSDMCQTIVEVGGYPASWIAAVDPTDGRLEVRTAHAEDAELGVALRTTPIEVVAGPVHGAIASGDMSAIDDVAALGEDLPWRAFALSHGYRSLLVLPLSVNGVDQALVIHARDASELHSDAVALLQIGRAHV